MGAACPRGGFAQLANPKCGFAGYPAIGVHPDSGRLLTEEDFGIMAIALIVVGVVEIFAQVGMGPSVVQHARLEPAHIASAWWFSAALGLLFFGGMYLAAPTVAHHYNEAQLGSVLRWISLSFVISGFSVVSRSLLIRENEFQSTHCMRDGRHGHWKFGVGLIMAWNGAGVWAYVSALLVQNIVLSLGYLWFTKIPITLGFHLPEFVNWWYTG